MIHNNFVVVVLIDLIILYDTLYNILEINYNMPPFVLSFITILSLFKLKEERKGEKEQLILLSYFMTDCFSKVIALPAIVIAIEVSC